MYNAIIILFSAVLVCSIFCVCLSAIRSKHSDKTLKTAGFYVSVVATIVSIASLLTSALIGEDTVNNFFNFETNYRLNDNYGLTSSEPDNKTIFTDNLSSKSNAQDSLSKYTSVQEQATDNSVIEESTPEKTKPSTATLKDCTTYAHDGSVVFEDVVSDPRGNSYNKAYLFYGEYYHLNTGGGEYGNSQITKYLGNKYVQFSATLNPYKTFDKYNKGIEATFNIYADDKLVYTTAISKSSENIQIEFDVTNINYLKFELLAATEMTSYQNQYSVILSNTILTTE